MSILVINPNTTTSMTSGLKVLISTLTSTVRPLPKSSHPPSQLTPPPSNLIQPPTYFTSPTGPASINSSADCDSSASAVLSAILAPLSLLLSPTTTTGILLACYSAHPLVPLLKLHTPVPVVGIFEASISAALLLLPSTDSKFGIVSTGNVWEELLRDGVEAYLGTEGGGKRFAGVETTGLSATELHEVEPAEVRRRMVLATRRLVGKGNVGAVCLGCAGMVGMEDWVKEACIEELGEEEGTKVAIIDGVKVGFVMLEGLVKAASV